MRNTITSRATAVGLAAAIVACAAAQPPAAPAPNTLGRAEAVAGWKLLFDGKTATGWRGYKKTGFPEKGWVVEDGCLRCKEKGGGGDIVTTEQYADFELAFEFKLAKGANSGVIYRAAETGDAPWQTGPEFQIIDDGGYPNALQPAQTCGSAYDLFAPTGKKELRSAGEFNTARIRIAGGLVQHFVNDVKVVEFRWDGDDLKQKVVASKFAKMAGFAAQPKGHIALQDHGNDIWYRSIRIRDLSAPMKGEVALLKGADLKGWTAHLPEGAKLADVWSVKDGVLTCKGNPVGYIRTEADYKNFVLRLEWRWNPQTKKTGNSGVLVRMIGPDKVWPRSVEAQLQHENAGDFWNIEDFKMKTTPERLNGRNTKKTHMAERAVGEWNEYEIVVDGTNVTLNVNGETLNRAWEVEEVPGKICLQSEGCEIQFRNVRVAPIE